MASNQFQVGDIVIKRYGSKPFRITQRYGTRVVGRYLHNNNTVGTYIDEVKPFEGNDYPATPSKTLYTFKDSEGNVTFGTHVGTNSQNLYILEVKGVDGYVVKDPEELEEVLPYTFSVKKNNRDYHYIGEPGKLSQGDWLILEEPSNSYLIVQVQAVNTKNKGAKKKFKGCKIVTTSD